MRGVESYLEVYKNCKAYRFSPEMVQENDCAIIMGSLDIAVTTFCTLKCRGCASLISLYGENRTHQDIDKIIHSLNRLLQNVNVILRVNILGGEPFLYPELHRLVAYMNQQPKILRVCIMTNGMVAPDNSLLYEELRTPKNDIRISEYNFIAKKQNSFLAVMEKENVKYTVKKYHNKKYTWYYFGGFERRERNQQERYEQLTCCSVEAQYLYNGKLYMCPRIAHGYELNLIPENDAQHWIDFDTDSNEDIQKKLCSLIFRDNLYDACLYCERGTESMYEIPVAEQI